MPARPRKATATIEVTYRTYQLPTAVRAAIKAARLQRKQTLRDFCNEAIRGELPGLLQAVDEVGVGSAAGPRSPVRIPLTDGLIDEYFLELTTGGVAVGHDWLIAEILRREAAVLINGPTKDPAPEPDAAAAPRAG